MPLIGSSVIKEAKKLTNHQLKEAIKRLREKISREGIKKSKTESSNDTFFCSELILSAFKQAGIQ